MRMLVEFECPECKGHLYERWAVDSPNPIIRFSYWHMLLNPGIAFNELILGQRLPAVSYVCKSCQTGMLDRSYIHCPCCDTFHPGRLWSYGNAFGNWLGLNCPTCGSEIPSLLGVTSRVLTYPCQVLLAEGLKPVRSKYGRWNHNRAKAALTAMKEGRSRANKPVNYVLMGVLFGGFMGVFSGIYCSIGSSVFNVTQAILTALCAGTFFGVSMRLFGERKGNKELHIDTSAIASHAFSSSSEQEPVRLLNERLS
jgi:predicted RNA-binding Zn-ribbon protein involved in translation (DUF1610 family)